MVILLDIVGMRDTYGMQRMAHVLPPFSLQQSPVREKARAKAAKVPPGCLTFCIGI